MESPNGSCLRVEAHGSRADIYQSPQSKHQIPICSNGSFDSVGPMRLIVSDHFLRIAFLPDIGRHRAGTAHRSHRTHKATARPKPATRVIVCDVRLLHRLNRKTAKTPQRTARDPNTCLMLWPPTIPVVS